MGASDYIIKLNASLILRFININEIMTAMNENLAIKQAREAVASLLQMRGHKSNPKQDRVACFALQNVVSQIDDAIIEFVISNPNAKIKITKASND